MNRTNDYEFYCDICKKKITKIQQYQCYPRYMLGNICICLECYDKYTTSLFNEACLQNIKKKNELKKK